MAHCKINRISKIALIILGVLGTSIYGQIIQIEERIEVDSDSLELGDVAPNLPDRLKRIPIGYSPYPGHYRWLSRSEVENYLRKWGLDQETRLQMPQKVLITRSSQQLDPVLIHEAVRFFLEDQFPDFDVKIRELEIPQDIVLPKGMVEVRVSTEQAPRRLDGSSLKIDFLVDSNHQKSQWVKLYATAKGQVPVLTENVKYGESIDRVDLTYEWREFSRVENFILNPEEVVGSVARRNLSKGSPLFEKDIEEPLLVERGDMVTLVARGRKIKISTVARARDAGANGDLITVENLGSRQLIQAKVVGKKTVEVVVAGMGR